MINRVRTGEFSHILVWKIDRISRNLLDFAAMYAELKKLGVTFVSKNEQFDTSSAMGEAMLKIILVFAELERNMTSERVSAIMLSRANGGVWNGGKIPFGYSYDKEQKVFHVLDDEAKVVLYIYDLYESIQSLTTVAKQLNEKGIRSRTGKPWNPVTVRTMLTNPFYAGTYRYNYRDESSRTYAVKPKDEWVMVEDHHPAIVTRERQNHIAGILEKHRRSNFDGRTYQRKNTHIFGGLLRCGYCGSMMSATSDRARSDGWRPSQYLCTRRRRFNDCTNKYITDMTIGPFVFNFIANMIRASKSFGKSTSIETLEKKLLRGEALAAVDHIGRPGLEELYNHLRSGFSEMPFDAPSAAAAESAANIQERELLLSEKRRLERALNRLRTLYLYSDDSMPEKDYIVERKQLMDSLDDVDAKLEAAEKVAADAISLSDEEFMAKASYFILSQQLQDKRFIDYERFIRKIDPKIVKDFLNSIATNFCIKDGLTTSILFRNGLELQFFYKPAETAKSPETF